MRILHVVHQYLPESVGGTELYTQSLAHYQAANGHSVAIFTPSPEDEGLQQTAENDIRIYRAGIGPRSRSRVFLSTFTEPQLEKMFTAVHQQEAPDLIHIQHLMGLPANLVKTIEVPFVITLHDYWYNCANAQLLTNYDSTVCQGPDKWFHNCGRCALARAGKAEFAWLAPTVAPIMRWRNGRLQPILQQAQRLIAPSPFIAQVYQQWGVARDKITLIPHGIEPPPEKLPYQSPPDRPFRIGYIGGLSWQKGVHCLVEAFQSLPDSELWIAGDTQADPPYVAHLRQLATPQVQFLGKLNREAIWQMLAQLDVVVVPSLWYETFCFVISEAFAAQVPVVAFNLGVMSQRIRDGVDGRLLPPGDIPALRHVLLQFQTNPATLAQLRQGIQPVRTMVKHVEEIEALYRTL